MTEYDLQTSALKQNVKVPAEAVNSPQDFSVNHLGQMLFVPAVSLPLDDDDLVSARKIWFWDGRHPITLDRDLNRVTGTIGSNVAITESVSSPHLSSDSGHLYWVRESGASPAT
jgi:hypothetical protein